jgi:hypothetical protein
MLGFAPAHVSKNHASTFRGLRRHVRHQDAGRGGNSVSTTEFQRCHFGASSDLAGGATQGVSRAGQRVTTA